jgi:hypothetical protein
MTAEQNLQPDGSLNTEDGEAKYSNLCGIVMPIAAMGDYTEAHWLDVQSIIKESVASAGYEARLVSESPDATVIIRSIVQNVYKDEIVICDVSGMNPNVMFELGMRLAFDKPVVIIKDEVTRFSFDISTIEHLVYPRSLRYQSIQDFKKKLAEKIKATAQVSKQEGYRSFLANFGSFTVANLQETTLNESEALETILTKLDKFDSRLLNLEAIPNKDYFSSIYSKKSKGLQQIILRKKIDGENFTTQKYQRLTDTITASFDGEIKVLLAPQDTSGTLSIMFTSDVLLPNSVLISQINSIFDSIFEAKE